MKLEASSLRINLEVVEKRIVKFLRVRLQESGQEGFVFGLSGGLDSSTIAALCSKVIRSDSILALIMPHKESDPQDKEDALLVVKKFNLPYKVIDITDQVEAVKANHIELISKTGSGVDRDSKLRNAVGNMKTRSRMVNLYMVANAMNRLVVGTSDKSEFLIGYYTKYGDGASDILPIADLYKTQVRALARRLGVPEQIIAKPPSPGWWKQQTAESEIGMTYERLDLILYGLERFMEPKEIADELNIPVESVIIVDKMIRKAEHKRRGGIVFKIGYRTPTLDWRVPL